MREIWGCHPLLTDPCMSCTPVPASSCIMIRSTQLLCDRIRSTLLIHTSAVYHFTAAASTRLKLSSRNVSPYEIFQNNFIERRIFSSSQTISCARAYGLHTKFCARVGLRTVDLVWQSSPSSVAFSVRPTIGRNTGPLNATKAQSWKCRGRLSSAISRIVVRMWQAEQRCAANRQPTVLVEKRQRCKVENLKWRWPNRRPLAMDFDRIQDFACS